ncbi:MAG: hypothetical protein ACP5MC_01700 [Candidatus Micrarchaeia archaeon]
MLSVSLVLLLGSVRAYSSTQLNTLLVEYNVSPSVIAELKPVYLNVSGKEYVVLYKNATPYFVVNTSTDSFVINATSIYQIISNYTFNTSFSKINLSNISSQMKAFEASSAGPIDDCLTETGLATGLTCNLSNYCNSCQVIPVCKIVLDKTSGPSGVLGIGIMQFESNYTKLNSSFNNFFSALSNVNRKNILFKLAQLNSSLQNISLLTRTIYENPIFTPQNVTPDMLATCTNYIANPSSAPWFCDALGFCEATTYNYSLLGNIQKEINGFEALPLSNQAIFSIAEQAAATELSYVFPVLSRQRLAQLNKAISSELGNYNETITNIESLLSHVNDTKLENGLVLLEKSYAALQSNYMSENISKAANETAQLLSNLSREYALDNASYTSALELAGNNTAKLLEAQLTNPNQKGLASLAFSELKLNSELGQSGISNVISINENLQGVSSKLAKYSTGSFSLIELARLVDGSFARPLAFALHLPYYSAVSAMPLLGALLSLIIGLVTLLAITFAKSYLMLKRKLVVNPRTRKNWRRLYEIALIIIAAYVIATYALLAYANSYAPFSAFKSSLQGSKYVVILVNGTSSLNAYSCASKIAAAATSIGKQPVLVTLSNGVCKLGNSTAMSFNACMNYYSAINAPLILLGSGSQVLSLYSLYGTKLEYTGNATAMSACYPALLLN